MKEVMFRRHLKLKNNNEYGFTLIELLVVILIIGVLAAIAIPAFLNQRQRANDAVVLSDVRNVISVIESELTAKPNGFIASGVSSASGEIRVGIVDVRAASLNPGEGVVYKLSPGVTLRIGTSNTPGVYALRGWHVNGKEYKNETVGNGPSGIGGYYYHSLNN